MTLDWMEICAKCQDGEIEPKECEYYGEPNGCNSPTYGEHPIARNNAAAWSALARIGNAIQEKMASAPCFVTEHERAIMNLCHRTFAENRAEPQSIHDVLKMLNFATWGETMFADLQWYYAEEGVYILRCKHGEPNEHLCIIRAKSADEAISRAVFDLHKANERKGGNE